ncbi:MAG: Rha family transcriptional regulator [Peptococcaceae bacterium]|nr:Rha family transcriptional regulator [Peptococcaceae bacterium]
MNSVVSIELENNAEYGIVVSSRKVAQGLKKQHFHVMRDLDKILENPDLDSLIIPAFYTVPNQKRKYKEYLLTKDGFTLYMFNIQGYNDFKWAYIQKFNEMEAALKAQEQCTLEKAVKEPVRKTFRGTPVMTTKDLAYFLKCPRYDVNYRAELAHVTGYLLTGKELHAFKKENEIRDSAARMLIFCDEEVAAILKAEGCFDEYKAFLRDYFKPAHNDEMTDDNMRFAIQQAHLLYVIAEEIRDPVVKEMNLKAINVLLLNIGLWEHKQHDVMEFRNLETVLDKAQKYWKW